MAVFQLARAAKPVLWASFSAELRFAWHSGTVGPKGAHSFSLILQLGPSQTLQSRWLSLPWGEHSQEGHNSQASS